MANILNRFNQSVLGSNSKLADYISKISSKGDFKRITDLQVILNSWNNILLTPRRSYQFDPEYGSDLYKMIFEPADERTIERIKRETIDVLQRYDDRANITEVNVKFFPNLKGFNIDIKVSYQDDVGQLQVIIDEDIYFKFLESVGDQ